MRVISDLHVHSRYSRAVSRDLDLEGLDAWAFKKGVDLVGTGDFTHPGWFRDIKSRLVQDSGGFYSLTTKGRTRFALTSEISCIYSKGGKTRRIHSVLVAPSIEAVELFNQQLKKVGKLESDGRPILGLDVERLLGMALDTSPDFIFIPAHIWTPWFSMFGSESGFDSVEECFGGLASKITAVETGLSSDPPMNWRLSQLDKCQIVSFSDAHSLPNLGREATVFEMPELTFKHLQSALRGGANADSQISETIEFYPEEGKYHWDGHRACHISYAPSETKKRQGICPVCKKELVVGVLHRVDALADRPEGFKPSTPSFDGAGRPPFRSLVPLQEIIAEAFDVGKQSKSVQSEYERLISALGSEFSILLDKTFDEIASIAPPNIVEAIRRVRERRLKIEPGFDGVFGQVKIFNKAERRRFGQKSLF